MATIRMNIQRGCVWIVGFTGVRKMDCNECDKQAVGVVKTDETSLFLCQLHFRKAREEYGPAIKETRLLTEVQK
jgi:hypothetical protein